MVPGPSNDEVAQVFRQESGRAIATLVRTFGSIDVAEDAVQEAFVAALRTWPEVGLPPNPGAWITTTARNRAIDRIRRESTRGARETEATAMHTDPEPPDVSGLPDDQLRLIFTCCHPALAAPARVALTLRLVGGLQTDEIAQAFLVPEATMAQRLVRAKRKIAANNIPYRVPEGAELLVRLRSVLAVVYLVFTEGHRTTSGTGLVREDLCADAIRLARLLADLLPDEPEVLGLLALLLLTEARRPARLADDGSLVLLGAQDRSLWDRALIDEGHALVRRCLRRNQPGRYQIQAAIAAVHASAATGADTDWRQIVALYDQLLGHLPTPVVQLNRAVAVAEVDGPQAGLDEVELLDLPTYGPFHAVRADLLRRLGRPAEAAKAYAAAEAVATNESEGRFLGDRRKEMEAAAGVR